MSEYGKLDIISGRKAVRLCSFHNAADHRAGLCIGTNRPDRVREWVNAEMRK